MAAINLVIWLPSSVEPSTSFVVTADLDLTLSWATSVSLSVCGQLSLTGNRWPQGYCKDTRWNLLCVFEPCGKGDLWGAMATLNQLLAQGIVTRFGLRSPPALWQRRELSHDFPA